MKFHKLIHLIHLCIGAALTPFPVSAALTLAFWMALTGCISVNLTPEDLRSAKEVSYSNPPSPFTEVISPGSDRAWKNNQNGNSITYITECGKVDSLSIHQAAKTSMRTQGIVVRSQNDIDLNGHKAVRSLGVFNQDKNPVHVELITFKADGCLVNLAYIGKKDSFEKDQAAFETFKQGFKGP